MRDAGADRNLLLGVLALQMDFLSRDALIAAMSTWVLDKDKTLGEILLDQGAIDPADLSALETMVSRHVARHGGKPEESLKAMSVASTVVENLRSIADTDVEASLKNLTAIPRDQSVTLTVPRQGPGGRYRRLRDHAMGGLGIVYVAHDTELNREVALKEIQAHYADDPSSRTRFVVEAEVTGGLEHPGIVPVYGLGRYDDGRPYYAMRFIKGDSLKDAIDRFHAAELPGRKPGERVLALQELLRQFLDVCYAIEYAHSRGILHRDLKPNNVMVGKYGETLVVDWGLAKLIDRSERDEPLPEATLQLSSTSGSAQTLPGSVVGTPAYMSPEQAAGQLDRLGPASDVYSLGATLYALLTGKAPLAGQDVHQLLQKVQRGEFAKPRAVVRWLDPALEAVCLKAMALTPGDRYGSPRALAKDVERWIADEPVSAYREPLRRRVGRWAKQHRTGVTAASAVALASIVLAVSGYLWEEQQRTERVARTESAVNQALARADGLRGEARANSATEPAKWDQALAAAEEANRLIGQGESSDSTRGRVHDLLVVLKREQGEAQERARRAAIDKTLLADLESIRGIRSEFLDSKPSDPQYAAAFRKAGLDLDTTDPKQAGAWIASRSRAVELASYLDDWSSVRRRNGADEPAWRRLIEAARAADPDAWRDALRAKTGRKDAEAIAEFRRLADGEDALVAQPVTSLMLLAQNLRFDVDDRERAARVLRLAWRHYPGDFWVNFELAMTEWTNNRFLQVANTVRYLSAAIAIRPLSSWAHHNLGAALQAQGNLEDAVGEYRTAIRLLPNDAMAHYNLAIGLKAQGKPVEAIAEYRAAIQIKPDYADAHSNLGNLLRDQGKFDEAVAEQRTAIEIKPDYAQAHNNLAIVFQLQGKLNEAIDETRAAIKNQSDYAEAHCNLGELLRQSGRYKEALEELRKGHEIGSKRPNWKYPSAERILQCEQLVALEDRLPAVIKGDDKPKGSTEGLTFGQFCYDKGLYATAARLWADTLADDPKLADDRRSQPRYNAACAAALAGSGKSKDDPPPDENAKAKLRNQARDWLEAELASWSRLLDTGPPQVRKAIQETLGRWKIDTDLASLRDEPELAKLPEDERKACEALWREVDAMLETSSTKAPVEKEPQR